MKFYYVYILQCADNGIYTGFTEDIMDRLARHQRGSVPATKERRPVSVVNYTAFLDKFKAIKYEKYLKSGSGRPFITRHLL
jgi:predicted GIY-YIG superfamily endonuclease